MYFVMTGIWRQHCVCNSSAGQCSPTSLSLTLSARQHIPTCTGKLKLFPPHTKQFSLQFKRRGERGRQSRDTYQSDVFPSYWQTVNYVIPCKFPTKVERQTPETSCVSVTPHRLIMSNMILAHTRYVVIHPQHCETVLAFLYSWRSNL
jgi:hypothetical protein